MIPSARVHSATVYKPQPKFGGAKVTDWAKSARNYLDFQEMGSAHVNQIKLIYACCIAWRLLVANERRKESPSKSWNEIRESLLRDSVGFLFWFFATPTIQRLYLKHRAPKAIRDSLVKQHPPMEAKGIRDSVRKFFKERFPTSVLLNWDIPSSQQVTDQMHHALADLSKKNIDSAHPAHKATQEFYEQLLKYRNRATGVGMLTTLLLLGVLINFFNIYITRKNPPLNQAATKQAPPRPPVPHSVPTMGSSMHRLPSTGASVFSLKPALPYGMPQSSQPLYGNAFNPTLHNNNPYLRRPSGY